MPYNKSNEIDNEADLLLRNLEIEGILNEHDSKRLKELEDYNKNLSFKAKLLNYLIIIFGLVCWFSLMTYSPMIIRFLISLFG